ncbi:hypothetical protein D3C87_489280 [compost metagenome]
MLSKTEKKMLVLDYVSLNRVATIPVGDDPHEVVTAPDGSLAYVSIPIMNGNGHEIDVLDLKTLQPLKVIDTRPFYIPHGLVYQPGKLWFTAQGSKSVAVYNTTTDKIEQVFGTGQDFTHLLSVSKNGDRFYTTNVESGTVSIYEQKQLPPYMPPTGVLPANAKPRTEWRQTLVPVGAGAEGFDIDKDGHELWTARPDGKIVVLDLDQQKVKKTIDTHVAGLHRMKITPDGKTVCVVSVKTGELLYYNKQRYQLEQKDHVGQGAGIFMDEESNRMFISCTPNNYVAVIDLTSRKVIKKLEVGRPDGITAVKVLE